MELALTIVDGTVTITCLLALFWFIVYPSHRLFSTLTISVLYLVGAPLDIIYGRTSSFWVSVLLSFMYLYLYEEEKRLKKKKS